ncbi:ATP-binding protein [Rhizorhabdus argentea]|uniref:ATP-binding protein n=1 Tax=Rhizorhabdus argentea TaxID=1387174 RepID=UPI0030ED3E56
MGAGDSESLSVTICCNGLDAVHRTVSSTHAFSEACGLQEKQAARLAIVVEELVFNLVEHGGVDEQGVIELVLTRQDGVVSIALSDTGVAFDLRDAHPEEVIPDRGGGAGIDLVRAWADIVDYGSHGGRNRLILKMRL